VGFVWYCSCGLVYGTAAVGLRTVLQLWACVRHCSCGLVYGTAAVGLCTVLQLWLVYGTAAVGLHTVPLQQESTAWCWLVGWLVRWFVGC